MKAKQYIFIAPLIILVVFLHSGCTTVEVRKNLINTREVITETRRTPIIGGTVAPSSEAVLVRVRLQSNVVEDVEVEKTYETRTVEKSPREEKVTKRELSTVRNSGEAKRRTEALSGVNLSLVLVYSTGESTAINAVTDAEGTCSFDITSRIRRAYENVQCSSLQLTLTHQTASWTETINKDKLSAWYLKLR
jgi:hypothetical protein